MVADHDLLAKLSGSELHALQQSVCQGELESVFWWCQPWKKKPARLFVCSRAAQPWTSALSSWCHTNRRCVRRTLRRSLHSASRNSIVLPQLAEKLLCIATSNPSFDDRLGLSHHFVVPSLSLSPIHWDLKAFMIPLILSLLCWTVSQQGLRSVREWMQ